MIPAVQDLLPHRPPMVLVEEVLHMDDVAGIVRCLCRLPRDSGLVSGGAGPRLIAIEMLAQSAACLKGWIELKRGNPVRPAYLVRVDDLEIGRGPDPGEAVVVEARETRGVADYFIYEARAEAGGDVLASGTLRFMVDRTT